MTFWFQRPASASGNRLVLPLSNSIASNHIPLSFENSESATSAADVTNCGTNAPHRNSYPGLEWDYVVGVHGGRPPYYLELLQAPSGMTVVQPNLVLNGDYYYWHQDHMRLLWQNPTAGTHTIEIRCTDQDGTQITSSWAHVCGTSGHVFVDPVSGSDGGTGLIGAPYQTFSPLSSGHAGDICHIYGGTISINSNYTITSGVPTSYIGVMGETVNIAETDGWLVLNTVDDAMLKRLTIYHEASGWSAVPDRRCIAQIGGCDRTNLTDLTFTNYTYGPGDQGNGAVFSSLGAIDTRQYLYNWHVSGDSGTVIQTFKHRGSIIRRIICENGTFANTDQSSSGGIIKLKDGWADQTIDFCEMYNNNSFPGNLSCVDLAGQDQSSLGITDTDVRYNRLWYTGSANQGGAIRCYTNIAAPDIVDTHFYRNSLKGTNSGDAWWNNAGLDPSTPNTHENENNVLENGNCPTGSAFLNTNNAEGTTTRFNSTMNLATGTQRDTYLGTHGAEIA